MRNYIALLLITALSANAYTLQNGTNYVTTGTPSDVQAAHDAGTTGDMITIPSGTFNWSSGVTITKAVRIQGGGSGRIVARSLTSITIGTGTKVFTIQREWPMTNSTITVGQTLRVWKTSGLLNTGNGFGTGTKPYMEGTVTSLSGSTLTMNITSTSSSGTFSQWIFDSGATTTINNNSGSALFTLNGSASGPQRLVGIRFMRGSGGGAHVNMAASGSDIPPVISQCWFDCEGSTHAILSATNRGLISQCTIISLNTNGSNTAGFVLKDESNIAVWTTTSHMGANDTGGNQNFYIEDCDFHGFWQGIDGDSGGKIVMRYCLLNECQIGTHGADTSNIGLRYLEFYKCICRYNDVGAQSANLNAWLLLRGGTGIIASNSFDDICCNWGPKNEIKFEIQNVDRNAGINPCWGAGIAGVQYHCPRQIGFGNVTGNGLDGLGRSVDGFGYYVGDSEPIYIWQNAGTMQISVEASGMNQCAGADSPSSYIQSGRDYILSTKPGWVAYTYPHPLAAGGSAPVTPPGPTGPTVRSLTVTTGTTITH